MTLINLVRFSLVLTFLVILLGAYTRLADAGLGCPDWPGCYGQLTVPTEQEEIALAKSLYPSLTVEADKAWLEMIHRYFAGSLGLIVFVISWLGWRTKQLSKLHSVTLSAVIIFQALLGMWTVTMMLMPIIVMGHLLGGFTLFCLLAAAYWRIKDNAQESQHNVQSELLSLANLKTVKNLSMAGLLVLVMQIALGGWTSSNYAALMCTSLPICEGSWSAHLDFKQAFDLIQPEQASYEFGTLDYGPRMTIHVTHRFGALLVTFVCLALIVALNRTAQVQLKQLARYLALMLVVQLCLGVANVLFSLPLIIAVAHNLGAAMLLLVMLRINLLVWQKSSSKEGVGANSKTSQLSQNKQGAAHE